jgi:hypothetical protein
MAKMIDVMSTAKARIIVNVPSLNFRRVWPRKGAVIKIPSDILEQAFYEPGVEYLFKTGLLFIEDMDLKIALGLEDEGTAVPTKVLFIDDKEAKKMLQEMPIDEFKEKLDHLSHDQLVDLAFTAVDIECTDYEKNSLLQKKTDINVYKAVADKKAEEARTE